MKPIYIKNKFQNFASYFFCSVVLIAGCKKFLVIDPPITEVSASTVYTNNETAIGVMTNLYIQYRNSPELLAVSVCDDEVDESSASDINIHELYTNSVQSQNAIVSSAWQTYYQFISTANSALENLANSTLLTTAVKQQLQGEALFMRALGYFQLLNLYGGVPMPLSTDYKTNQLLGRSSEEAVWQQANKDVRASKEFLSKEFLDANLTTVTNERVRPTYWAAASLLARIALYHHDWAAADSAASLVINNSSLFALQPLDSVFLKNNREAIWQIQNSDVNGNGNTYEANTFTFPSNGPGKGFAAYYMDSLLYNDFEVGDLRRDHWTTMVSFLGKDYPSVYKYKINYVDHGLLPTTEYSTRFRLAEQYLIRAEARAQLNNLSGARSDLNIIRKRAGLPDNTSSTQSDLLAAIQHERRVELFTEGFRWFDLKRTGAIDSVMKKVTPIKGGAAWDPNQALWPIPPNDISADPTLKDQQNPGYN